MIAIKQLYEERKQEIDVFIEFISFLEQSNQNKFEEESRFDNFFNSENGINVSYQVLINILKSNLSLMIYSLIEFTVTNLMECIYDKIKFDCLSYLEVNDLIKKIWKKTMLKEVKQPNANFNTFVKKNEEIIDLIVNKSIIELNAKDTLPYGNLDYNAIKKAFQEHGIPVNTRKEDYKKNVFKTIRDNRNKLSHGTISFVEALRNDSIGDIDKNKKFIVNFLDEIIESVSNYLVNEEYKHIT